MGQLGSEGPASEQPWPTQELAWMVAEEEEVGAGHSSLPQCDLHLV